MPRRASLPGADLLFGSTAEVRPTKEAPVPEEHPAPPAAPPAAPAAAGRSQPEPARQALKPRERARGASGPRPRHEEKITFYCTDSDLTRLEAARLDLRANYRLATDRGRIVRAAIAEVLDDFDARGADSALVKRLSAE